MTQAPTPEPLRRRLVLLAALLVTAVGGLWWASGLDAAGIFDAHAWARQTDRLLAWQQQSPVLFMAGFMFLFVLLSVLALPGCWALSLLAGSAFGTFAGTLLVGLASTLGALLAFFAARHWGRDRMHRRLGHRLHGLNNVIERHGALGLVGLRLLPVLPYPLLNPLLGLSRMSVPAFFWPSLVGLTLGSLPYVWAGQSLQAYLRCLPGPHLLWLTAACILLLVAFLATRLRRLREAE